MKAASPEGPKRLRGTLCKITYAALSVKLKPDAAPGPPALRPLSTTPVGSARRSPTPRPFEKTLCKGECLAHVSPQPPPCPPPLETTSSRFPAFDHMRVLPLPFTASAASSSTMSRRDAAKKGCKNTAL